MIKLTISSDSSPNVTRRFNQSEIIIGGEHALDADIKLLGQSLQDRHVLITKELDDGRIRYYVINQANDPFVTLNNLPFGKQPIDGNDLIQISDYTIRFENESQLSANDSLHKPLAAKDKEQDPLKYSKGLITEPEHSYDSETLSLKKKKIDPEAKAGSSEFSFPYTQNPLHQFSEKPNVEAQGYSAPSQSPKLSLKDYYLSEYDDNEENPLPKFEKNLNPFSPEMAKSWRSFLALLGGLIAVMTVIAIIAYVWVSDQTGEEETIAARSVSDIAMALTHAQLKNIYPQNQNWSYPDFINNNLNAVLAPNHISFADVDIHGQFANCPYMLRIHSSSDLSQFIVIAQPCPSLLQWLIPKASIIVDSLAMELRKVTDLKPLNRSIVHSSSLDGANEKEISSLIKNGKLIPLSDLINKAENQGFSPPKALALMHPGAENYIYNAPRYYLLGEAVLHNSLDLVDKNGSPKETGLLQQELTAYSKFPYFVLYSSGGFQKALKAQQALGLINPKDKFLIAYLQMNNQGKITNAHLLIDDAHKEVAIDEKWSNQLENKEQAVEENEVINAEEEIASHEQSSDTSSPLEATDEPGTNSTHPVFLQLKEIVNSRQIALEPYADEIIIFVKKQTTSSQPNFTNRLSKLKQRFETADRKEKEKSFKKISNLIYQNPYLPAEKFVEYVDTAHATTLFEEYLKSMTQKTKDDPTTDEQIKKQFEAIQNSTSWQNLEKNAIRLNHLLQFDNIPDEDRLVRFQNDGSSLTKQKLDQFILSSTDALPTQSFDQDYIEILTNILKAVWITDPETHDFYIDEFELRVIN